MNICLYRIYYVWIHNFTVSFVTKFIRVCAVKFLVAKTIFFVVYFYRICIPNLLRRLFFENTGSQKKGPHWPLIYNNYTIVHCKKQYVSWFDWFDLRSPFLNGTKKITLSTFFLSVIFDSIITKLQSMVGMTKYIYKDIEWHKSK